MTAGAMPATATGTTPVDPTPGPAGAGTELTGTYYGMPDEMYHGRTDSLSYSGAKLLLPPGCPALFKWDRDNVRPSKTAWDIGHAFHTLVLGVGAEITIIEADSWRTKAAQTERQEAYDAGAVPVLRKDYGQLTGMAASVRAHPLACTLFDPANGTPEVSLFMRDDASGVNLRGRVDFLPHSRDGRMILPDLKSSISADPESFAKAAANYSYNLQSVFYQDLVTGLGLADEVVFVFVVVAKDPPYLVSVIQLDEEAERIGRALKQQAIEIYAECTATDTWPSYDPDPAGGPQVSLVQMPRWYTRTHSQDYSW